MNNFFFSVIIPTYNRSSILRKTINSVLIQTFKNFEVIIIDDGSTDNTKELVESIEDPRVKYIYQTNKERSAARNNGIRNSNGQYICFLDSDDLYEPNHLEVLFNFIAKKNKPVELFFTNCYHLIGSDKRQDELPVLEVNPLNYFLVNSVIPARVCVHKNILNKLQFRESIVIVEDAVLWIEIANAYAVNHIKEYTVQYRLHDDNSINIKNNCFSPRLDGLNILFRNKEISREIGIKEKKEAISNCYLGMAKHYEFKRMFFKMITNLVKSFLINPISNLNKFKIYMIYRYLLNKADV
jgi:glycosyltransferase involved in cell wall biosynthesis